jgi:hypothetical protein
MANGSGQGPIGSVRGAISPLPRRLAVNFGTGCSNSVLIPKNPKLAHYGLKLMFVSKQRKSIASKSLDYLLSSKNI